jgi:hypothetical protein
VCVETAHVSYDHVPRPHGTLFRPLADNAIRPAAATVCMNAIPRSQEPPDSRHHPNDHHEATPRRSKSTLFCPICGHDSPAGGDWLRRVGPTVGREQTPVSNGVVGRGVALVCPDCDTVVTVRRR